jgi:hypothetical protein
VVYLILFNSDLIYINNYYELAALSVTTVLSYWMFYVLYS